MRGCDVKNKKYIQQRTNHQPRVGIFWYYKKKLLTYSFPMKEVEEQSGFIDVGMGHYDLWSTFQKLDRSLKNIKYEDLPRGRILYDVTNKIYKVSTSSKIIQTEGFQDMVLSTFNLPVTATVFEADVSQALSGSTA
jgi:hypothetical protein